MANYEPIDNDSDIDEFDVEKIEQMKVEFKICSHCGGEGFGIMAFIRLLALSFMGRAKLRRR